MPAVDNEQAAVLADVDAVHGVPLVGAGVLGILGRRPPVHQEFAVLVELGNPRAAIAIADEKRAVGKPGNIGRPIEEPASVASTLSLGAERHHELAVVGELVDHMELVVEHPDVLLWIVGAHLDLVGTATARRLEELVMLRPRLDHLPGTINDEDDVVIPALPPALGRRLARGAKPIVVARRATPRRIQHGVRRPGRGAGRQRQLAALSDPDAVRRLGVDRAD